MSVALVGPTDTVPVASDLTVAEAYWQLCDLVPGPCNIDWSSSPCPGSCGYDEIIRRFSRRLDAEAWLVATPVDGDPSYPVAVATIVVTDAHPSELLVWGGGHPPVALRVGPSLAERKGASDAG